MANYSRTHKINYTDLDDNLQLSVPAALSFAQNMMTEFFLTFGSDNINLKAKSNAIWVVTKTKLFIKKYPTWVDSITADSYITQVKPIRVQLESKFTNADDEMMFFVKQESCPIDLDTRRIRKINTVEFPTDMETIDSISDETFSKLNATFSENDKVLSQKMFSTDIDYSGHVNNVVYARLIMNCLDCEFLHTHKITDFEIHYISESKETQILDVYKLESDHAIEFLIKNSESEVVRAKISLTQM